MLDVAEDANGVCDATAAFRRDSLVVGLRFGREQNQGSGDRLQGSREVKVRMTVARYEVESKEK